MASAPGAASDAAGLSQAEPEPEPPRPRRAVFSLDGRATPGLYAAGWFLTLLGLTVIAIILMGGLRGFVPAVVAEGAMISLAAGLLAGAGSQALQRRADHVRGFAGPSPFLVFVAMIACLYAVQLPLSLVFDALGIKPDTALSTFLGLLIYLALYAGLVRLLVIGTGALTWSDIVHPKRLYGDRAAPEPPPAVVNDYWPGWQTHTARRSTFADVMLGVGLAIPLMFISGWLGVVLYQLLGLKPTDIPSVLPAATSTLERLLVLVTAAVIAPIGEELFFRGFAMNAWARRMAVNRAIVRGALFFAFVHILDVNVFGSDASIALRAAAISFLVRVPVAVALCWVYVRRRSLYASIGLHATYNGLLEVIGFIAGTA